MWAVCAVARSLASPAALWPRTPGPAGAADSVRGAPGAGRPCSPPAAGGAAPALPPHPVKKRSTRGTGRGADGSKGGRALAARWQGRRTVARPGHSGDLWTAGAATRMLATCGARGPAVRHLVPGAGRQVWPPPAPRPGPASHYAQPSRRLCRRRAVRAYIARSRAPVHPGGRDAGNARSGTELRVPCHASAGVGATHFPSRHRSWAPVPSSRRCGARRPPQSAGASPDRRQQPRGPPQRHQVPVSRLHPPRHRPAQFTGCMSRRACQASRSRNRLSPVAAARCKYAAITPARASASPYSNCPRTSCGASPAATRPPHALRHGRRAAPGWRPTVARHRPAIGVTSPYSSPRGVKRLTPAT
jgi:hypothetical protein